MKILIFSNNALSNSNSNGRTILNMLFNFKKNDVLNVFISGSNYAFDKSFYYKVNERLLANPLKFKFLENVTFKNEFDNTKKNKNRSVFKLLVRNIIWKRISLRIQLYKIAKDFRPDVVFVQCGDNAFLMRIALKISKHLKRKICIFNTEEYIFKEIDYINKTTKKGFLFRMFQRQLIRAYNLIYRYNPIAIYLTHGLYELFHNKYRNKKDFVIYNSSNIRKINNNGTEILYFGNLDLGRHKTLIDLSKLFYKYMGEKIKIFSGTNDDRIISSLKEHETIDFRGFIPYEQIEEEMKNAQIILHVESTEPFYEIDSRNAFSTKIPDCLASGIPFFIFASKNSFLSKYMDRYNCSFVVSTLKEAELLIAKFNDYRFLNSKNANNLAIAEKNHRAFKNSDMFYDIISSEI